MFQVQLTLAQIEMTHEPFEPDLNPVEYDSDPNRLTNFNFAPHLALVGSRSDRLDKNKK